MDEPPRTSDWSADRASGELSQRALLLLALGLEGLLGILGWVWIALQGRDAFRTVGPSLEGTAAGLAGTVGAIVLVVLFYDGLGPRISWVRGFRDWVESQLLPLLAPAGTWAMLAIAASAGVGEELFFRGAMQPVLGLIPTAVIFGLAHVGGLIRREMLVYFLFTLVWGLAFGWAYGVIGVLWPLMVVHAGYDFGIVMYMRATGRRGAGVRAGVRERGSEGAGGEGA